MPLESEKVSENSWTEGCEVKRKLASKEDVSDNEREGRREKKREREREREKT